MALRKGTQNAVDAVFKRLDYRRLGPIYCDEGGDAFWRARRGPCRRLGSAIAAALRGRLKKGGRSLYVGAGVAEIPALLMETMELGREAHPANLRRDEVKILNNALIGSGARFIHRDAAKVRGRFDHLWAVSVFNDPERFPQLSALSYSRADPAAMDLAGFRRERYEVLRLVAACMGKLTLPALVTTSVEEVEWFEDWCSFKGFHCCVEPRTWPTAIVRDPVCFIEISRH